MAIPRLNDIRHCDVHLMKQQVEVLNHVSNNEILALLCNLIEEVGRLERRVKALEDTEDKELFYCLHPRYYLLIYN